MLIKKRKRILNTNKRKDKIWKFLAKLKKTKKNYYYTKKTEIKKLKKKEVWQHQLKKKKKEKKIKIKIIHEHYTKNNWKKDYIFSSNIIQKAINKLILKGKKKKAEKLFYTIALWFKFKTDICINILIWTLSENFYPKIHIIAKKFAGDEKLVPTGSMAFYKNKIFLKWIIAMYKKQTKHSTRKWYRLGNISDELKKIKNEEEDISAFLVKRNQIYTILIENRALNEYRWI